MSKISIICPVFNEQDCIPIFYKRLTSALSKINVYEFEIIFTDNASTDDTYKILRNLANNDSKISIISLSRNFGYQKSLMAGISNSTGDAVIPIDVDCEDPPELIATFIKHWEQGYDIVYGLRQGRPEPKIITFFRNAFYWLLKRVGDNPINLNMAEFSLLSRAVCNQILLNKTTYPFIRNEIAYIGLNQIAIPYNREERVAGKTHYNLFRMFNFAFAGILTSSTFPLRISLYFLPFVILVNIIFVIFDAIFPGATNINRLVIFDLMYISTVVSFISIYISRIYHDVTGRPIFCIDMKKSIINTQAPRNKDSSHV